MDRTDEDRAGVHVTVLKRSREGFTVAYCIACRWTCSGDRDGIERSRKRHEEGEGRAA